MIQKDGLFVVKWRQRGIRGGRHTQKCRPRYSAATRQQRSVLLVYQSSSRYDSDVESEIVFPFNNANDLFNHARNICFEVTFNTEPTNQHVRIFSDYLMKLTLIANHTQNINH